MTRNCCWFANVCFCGLVGALAGCMGPRDSSGTPLPRNAEWLDAIDMAGIEQDWGMPHARQSVDGHPLKLAGKSYQHGIGTHANSDVDIQLTGKPLRFESTVGVDDETGKHGSVVFIVTDGSKELARSRVLRGGDPPERMSVDLHGAVRLVLRVEDADDGIDNDHADWADARVLYGSNARGFGTLTLPTGPDPEIAPPDDNELAIHAPYITGGTPGRPFLFRIPATGKRPLRFTADHLPAGLSLNQDAGIIIGSLTEEGRTEVHMTVENSDGRAGSTLTIFAGPRMLARTPPMGWNSWNCWATSVDDARVRAAADWMVKSGLADRGFQYINIDDAWEGKRDAKGRIQSNEKFPDMKALADYVHSKGLKLGIYSSPGDKTCAGYEATLGHEDDDARTWAEWGVDLIKYDWCSYGKVAPHPNAEQLRAPYRLMRRALDDCGRDIVFSLCQYGMGDVWTWGADVGGNYWRTTDDITDTWTSMSRIGFRQNGHERFGGPGHWNDPDMLVVGNLGWSDKLHPTRLTRNEQVTHITLWSMLAAPLLIGCDLANLDEFTKALLSNPEVLAVSQDSLGWPAHRAVISGDTEAWQRTLADGSVAVAIFNRGRGEITTSLNFSALGLAGEQRARDLWRRTDVELKDQSITAKLSRHGAALFKLTPAGASNARGGSLQSYGAVMEILPPSSPGSKK